MAQARTHLVAAVGQQKEERMRSATSCQVMEEFQAGVIAPVQVFQHTEHGMLPGLARQEVGQDLKAVTFLLFRIEQRRGELLRFINQQMAEIRKQGEEGL